MSQRYTVTTFDICAEGFERLRNQDEFILLGYVTKRTTRKSLTGQFHDDIQSCDRGDGFDYDSARNAVSEYMRRFSAADMKAALRYVDSEGCTAFLYLRDNQAEDCQ